MLVNFGPHTWNAEKELIGTFAEERICDGESSEYAIPAD